MAETNIYIEQEVSPKWLRGIGLVEALFTLVDVSEWL